MRHAPLKQRKLPPYGSWLRLFAADVCGQVGQKRRRRAARGEDQLVLCARHAHIKEPALLFRIRVCRDERRRIAVQKGAPPSSPSRTKNTRAQGTTFTRKKRKAPMPPSPHKKRTGARYALPRTECVRRRAEWIRAAPALFSRKGTFPSPISDLKSLCGTRRRNDRQGAPCLRRKSCSRAADVR